MNRPVSSSAGRRRDPEAAPPETPDQLSSFLSLDADQHLLLPARRSWKIICHSGLIWITQQGCLDDWVLRSGESMQLHDNAVLIGAVRRSQLQLIPASSAVVRPVAAFRALLSLLARRLLNRCGSSFMLAGAAAIPVERKLARRAPRPGRRW